MTKSQRVLKELKKHKKHGVANYKLSRLALNYTKVISNLREDGHNIQAVRVWLKNGRATNTFKYYLIEE